MEYSAQHNMYPLHFTVQYEPAHLRAIYYPNGKPTVMRHRSHRILLLILIVCFIFLLIGSLNFSVSPNEPNEFAVLMLVASVLLGSGSAVMLFKSIRLLRSREKRTEQYIASLCANGPLTIIVDQETITQQSPHHITSIRWEDLWDVEITSGFIYISDCGSDWLYPKASMDPSEFENLAAYVSQMHERFR